MDEANFSSEKICSNKEMVCHTTINNSVESDFKKSEDNEFNSTPDTSSPIIVYPQRFLVLGVFSLLGWFQCCQWNTWGPINQSVMEGFGWSSGTVAMMTNWSTITYILFVVPICWLITNFGLRYGVLTCSGLIAIGTAVRCVSIEPTTFTILCHISAICIGTAGTVFLAAPAMIAADWFPTEERLTATAVAMIANGVGGIGSYLEPLIVRSPGDNITQDQIIGDIRTLMFIYAGFGALLFILTIIYFPSRPKTPPSISSSKEKLNFKDSAKSIFRNKSMILVLLPYSIGIGIPFIWTSVMNFSLNSLGINQDEAMWIGIFETIMCGITGILFGRLTDLMYGYIRGSLIFIFLAASLLFYWFSLLTSGIIPVTTWQVYITVGFGLGLLEGAAVLIYELAVETAYPCSEVIVGGLLYAGNVFCGSLFLLVFMFPLSGYNWIPYVLLCSTAISSIPLLFLNDQYKRSKIDGSGIL